LASIASRKLRNRSRPRAPKFEIASVKLSSEETIRTPGRRIQQTFLQIWQERLPNSSQLPNARAVAAIAEENPGKALGIAKQFYEAHRKSISAQLLFAGTALVAGAPEAEQINGEAYSDSQDLALTQWIVLPESARVGMAYFASRRGDQDAARKWLDAAETIALRAWKDGVDTPTLAIEIAAIHTLRRDNDAAMQWMQRAYDRGWRIRVSNVFDPVLAGLRGDIRFKNLMQRMQGDLARMRNQSAEVRELFAKTVPSLPPPARK
jgi:hypothetical protein